MDKDELEAIELRMSAASSGICGYHESGYCNGKVYRLGIQFTERGGMRLGDAVFHSHAYDDVRRLLAAVDARDRENEELRVFLVIAAAGLVTADEKEDDAPASAMEHRDEVKDTLLQACPNTEEEWARLVAKGVLGPIRAKLCLARHALYGEINKLERENASLREVVQSLQQEGSGRLRYD